MCIGTTKPTGELYKEVREEIQRYFRVSPKMQGNFIAGKETGLGTLYRVPVSRRAGLLEIASGKADVVWIGFF